MKKLVILSLTVLISNISLGQSAFLDQMENMDGVSSVVVNKDAFEILSKFKIKGGDDEKTVEIFNLIKDLNELRTYKTEDEKIAKKMFAKVKTYVENSKLKELIRAKEKGAKVKIYTLPSKNKNIVNQVLMCVERNIKTEQKKQFVVVSLTGQIDINKLSNIADHF